MGLVSFEPPVKKGVRPTGGFLNNAHVVRVCTSKKYLKTTDARTQKERPFLFREAGFFPFN